VLPSQTGGASAGAPFPFPEADIGDDVARNGPPVRLERKRAMRNTAFTFSSRVTMAALFATAKLFFEHLEDEEGAIHGLQRARRRRTSRVWGRKPQWRQCGIPLLLTGLGAGLLRHLSRRASGGACSSRRGRSRVR
jgi:hypothetical protein